VNVGGPVAAAVAEGRLPGRVWFYSTYACNLACTYCLTESAPGVARRALAGERMVELAAQAANLAFTYLGVTGGAFLSPELPTVLAEMAAVLPTVVLTNGTCSTMFAWPLCGPWLACRYVSRFRSTATSPHPTTPPGVPATSPRWWRPYPG